jgi:hypothetical protein
MQNRGNQTIGCLNKTGFKGVQLRNGRYIASIATGGGGGYLGSFCDPIAAALAYDAAARIRYGEFACLNFPGPGERSARPQGAANTLGAEVIQSSHVNTVVHVPNLEHGRAESLIERR